MLQSASVVTASSAVSSAVCAIDVATACRVAGDGTTVASEAITVAADDDGASKLSTTCAATLAPTAVAAR